MKWPSSGQLLFCKVQEMSVFVYSFFSWARKSNKYCPSIEMSAQMELSSPKVLLSHGGNCL